MDNAVTERFRSCFGSMAVYKDLKNSNFFATLALPSYLRDWLLQKHQDDEGNFRQKDIADFVSRFLPRPADWVGIKDRIIIGYEKVRILARIVVDINIATGDIAFSLPDYGVHSKDTLIEYDVWEQCKDDLVSGHETWGMLELGYRPPNDKAKPKQPGKIKLLAFRNFCPYQTKIDYYRQAREIFSISEWIDILLSAVDYNPAGYAIARQADPSLPEVETAKLTMLARLLPFLEKRLNVMELAPKGTGKSYIFGQVSRYGWLSTSDKMTRAKLFYDMGRRETGLVMQNDFLVLDEIQKTVFDDGMGATLQGYLEQGTFSVGNYSGSADCGMVLCGNIAQDIMKSDGHAYMFANLPAMFHDPAIIDRFHGFIKGWNIPRMNDDLKICGWALNSEYFTTILHSLREDSSYRVIVDDLLLTPAGADTRDVEAIKRIATALLKLLFPNVQTGADISASEFERYCLRPASQMRLTIKNQLAHMDTQYSATIPVIQAKR